MTTHDTTSRQRAATLARTFSAAGIATLLIFGAAGCKSSSSSNAATTAAINNGTAVPGNSGADPADGNLAPATQAMGENSSYNPQQQGESYQGQQNAAPVEQGYNGQDDGAEYAGEQAIDQTDQPPPPLPDYDQPPAPDPNYIWTPGYWAWGNGGYFWVPGAWVAPPYYGALWTPPYWGYNNGQYGFYSGYWGPHVGYYGGVDYGFGYIGIGFFGGYWNGNNFYYNRSVTNVGNIGGNYVYNHSVIYNNVRYGAQPVNRVSYNGGRGGINVRPTPSEMAARGESHTGALPQQRQVMQSAEQNKQQFYSANHGKPTEAVSARPVANPHGIAAPPAAVRQDEQRATQQRAADIQRSNPAGQRGAPAAQHGNVPATEQRGVPTTGQRGAPATEHNNVRPAEQRTAPVEQNRAAPVQRNAPAATQYRSAPVQRAAPAAQRPTETRSAPIERAQPARPAPQPAPREEPAPRAQPAPRQQAHPAPARPESHTAPRPQEKH